MTKNMLIGQSGGPTAAINASLAGAIRRGMVEKEVGEIYGAKNGLEGVLRGDIINLRASFQTEDDFLLLSATPAMALGSCRLKLAQEPDETYEKVRQLFLQYNIGYFFYIGGNDSMDTVEKLAAYFAACHDDIQCVGIPKTIDNDLPGTDHTPGFGSAARLIATLMAETIADSEAYNLDSVTVVEIMGRDAGWLAASSVLARRNGCMAPHLIYLPEVLFDPQDFLARLRLLRKTVKNIVVAVSEGIRLPNGDYMASAEKTDAFGHKSLAGVGRLLEELVRENLGCKVRSMELNVLQRAGAHCASATDLREAAQAGEAAVRYALQGKTGIMVTLQRLSQTPYLIDYGFISVSEAANKERKVPLEWITQGGCDVSPEMTNYLLPLIQGPVHGMLKNGLPLYFSFQ